MMMINYLVLYIIMFVIGGISFISFRNFLLLMLLSLELMMLALMMILLIFIFMFKSEFYLLILFMVMMVCEGVLGLSVLVMMMRIYGNDYFQSFNLLQC
uniref:NADH-ubiquinone oxidoreductase chain 4L n=1 Tax=Stenopsyche tienmushanensis TaxID=1560151 RepID=A0A8A0XYX7_9NEOP|nr:NADH dehydrogenase subunit 4L [Stenopsyche tienmushanensis]QSQ87276.1 NADH dehydrogenase subunit 4L [Stenopsyche tienmushanensis]UDU84913.1 NADH dehydrogenase subunit 4L [Stenopsyche tienmushanensis]